MTDHIEARQSAEHAARERCLNCNHVATLPPKPVDGRTDPCPAPGYAGRHTAVGAGAISPPYRCHGCGAWFTLPAEPTTTTTTATEETP